MVYPLGKKKRTTLSFSFFFSYIACWCACPPFQQQEIIQARWGNTAHKVFLVFALLTNIIVTSMLLLGGAATVNALTGMNLNLASFLIPWGVIAYTAAGGLKATFLASYTHTAVLFVALLIFVFVIYTGSDEYVGR